MLKSAIDTLSGNVPGGIGLYLVVLLSIFFSLYFVYRANEFFTRRLFRRWLISLLLLCTAGYAYLWVQNPPPSLLKRYSVIFYSENSRDRWLADFFRDELSEALRPYKSRQNYFFPQRWFYLADFPDSLNEQRFLRKLIAELPLETVLLGKVVRDESGYRLELTRLDNAGAEARPLKPVRFKKGALESAYRALLRQASQFLPVRKRDFESLAADSNFVLLRDAFYRGKYTLAQKYADRLNRPEQPLLRRWRAFIQIRLAAELRARQKPRNPYEFRKAKWQKIVELARSQLIQLMRAETAKSSRDDVLNTMMGESYLLTESFGDAEVFLKNAYVENPFNIETLENLSLLYPSRLKDLHFADDAAVLEKILIYCPLYSKILERFVLRMLRRGPVGSIAFQKAKSFIDHFLEMNPKSAAAWLLLGKYWEQMTRDDMALRIFLKVDSLAPGNSTNKFNLGVIYFRMEDYPKAIKYFKQAISLDDYLNAHLYLGAIYKQQGRYREALKEFRYRVAHQQGSDDFYALQAMKGIRECLKALNIPIPGEEK